MLECEYFTLFFQYLKRIHEAQEAPPPPFDTRARALAQDERQCRSYLTLARFVNN